MKSLVMSYFSELNYVGLDPWLPNHAESPNFIQIASDNNRMSFNKNRIEVVVIAWYYRLVLDTYKPRFVWV